MTDLAPKAEITKADIDRVDAVDQPATGIEFAIIKGLDEPAEPAGPEAVQEAVEKAADGQENVTEEPESVEKAAEDAPEAEETAEEPVEKAEEAPAEPENEPEAVEKSAEEAPEAENAPEAAPADGEIVIKADELDEIALKRVLEIAKAAAAPPKAPAEGEKGGGAGGPALGAGVLSLFQQVADVIATVKTGVEADAAAAAPAPAAPAAPGAPATAEQTADVAAAQAAESPVDTGDAEDVAEGAAPADAGAAAPAVDPNRNKFAKSAEPAEEDVAERVAKAVASQLRAILERAADPSDVIPDDEAIAKRVESIMSENAELKKQLEQLRKEPIESGVLLAGNTAAGTAAPMNEGQGEGALTREAFLKAAQAETDPAKRTELAMQLVNGQFARPVPAPEQ